MNAAIEYVNKVAPHHDRTGCRDDDPGSEARFAPDDFGGCYRCTILHAVQLAVEVERATPSHPEPAGGKADAA